MARLVLLWEGRRGLDVAPHRRFDSFQVERFETKGFFDGLLARNFLDFGIHICNGNHCRAQNFRAEPYAIVMATINFEVKIGFLRPTPIFRGKIVSSCCKPKRHKSSLRSMQDSFIAIE
jgi:hypothetical protein